LELIDGKLDAKLQQGVFELKDFKLTEKDKDTVLISIPSFTVQGISADVKTREIVVEQVKTADARIESWLNSDGTFNFQSLFMSDLQKFTEVKKSGSSEPKPTESSPWHATIRKIEIDNWGAVIEDRTLPKPVRFSVDGLTVRVENLENKKDSQAQITLELKINRAGTVKVNGSAGIDPLTAELEVHSDKIALKDFQPYVDKMANVRISAGTASSKGRILYQAGEGTMNARLEDGVFELIDLQVTEKDKDKVLVSIPSFAAQGISADLKAREIVVEKVKTADARIESWITLDGTFNLQNLIIADSQKLAETKKSDSTEPKPAESSPWLATVHKIEVDKWGVAIEDRTLPKPARITVDDVTVRVENLANKKSSKAKVALTLQINQAGTVKVNGSAIIDPLSADLSVISDNIALKSFQPYVDAAVNAQIASGTTSSKGRIIYKGKESQPQIRYQGELSLDGVEVKDRIQTEDFISQKQLKASGIILDIHPNKLQVADVLVDKTNASITIEQNGTVNVVQAFTPVDKKGEKGKENLIERLVNFLILQIKGPIPMSIDLVKIDKFTVDFIDESIAPPFKTELEIANATVEWLSSEPSARADFKIDGTIDQTATIKSSGQMNPLNAMHYAKVDFVLKDFQLPPVSPYSGKYAGFKIEDGKLDLEMKYRVDNNSFSGDNKIFVDRMVLGEKIDSPAATDLPVGLAVTLLKGADGRITLQVPVSGDIADPKFDFGQVVLSALTGAMTKASSPPPSADADGASSSTVTESSTPSTTTEIDDVKGEDVRFIEFEFGLSKLSEQARKKLDALAKFLTERSALTLGIEGTANRRMDQAKIAEKQAKQEKPSSEQEPAKDPPVDDKQLAMLALTRANEVKKYLIQKGKIAETRIQLKHLKIKAITAEEYGRVELYLSGQ
jgi:outer membrane protein OmpA-like peptidoglycan-associated protein